MLRRLSYFLSLVLLALSAVSCFENDLPYPYVRASITGLEAEGVISCEIDEPRNTITLHLDETTDIKRVNITGVTYGQKETWPEKEIRGEKDLREPLYVTLRTYEEQRYVWKIQAKQSVSRAFRVQNQVGKTVFDDNHHLILATVSKSISLTYIVVDSVKLGPRDITTCDIDLKSVHNFTEPVDVTLSFQGRPETEDWQVWIQQSDKDILVNSVSPRSRRAWLDASGLAGKANGVRYRQEGETEWKECDSTIVEGGSFQCLIDTLQPLTTYEYVAYTGEEETDPETFTTEDEVPVPNGGFEFITPAGSFYEWYHPDAPAAPERTAWWGSGNGSKVMGISGSADMGYVITEPDETDKASGERSAKLISRWAVVKFAAGNLFSGYFAGLVGTKGGMVNYGRPFTLRPDSLKCCIKYHCGPINRISETDLPADIHVTPGQNDKCQVFIALGTWDYKKYGGSPECPVQVNTTNPTTKFAPDGESVIAYGEYTLDHSTLNAEGKEDWMEISIPFVYADNFTVPTHVVISFASSSLGDYFTGSDQSVLWVDDVRFVY